MTRQISQREAERMLEILERGLAESGCDGDLCAHAWHQDAREIIAQIREDE